MSWLPIVLLATTAPPSMPVAAFHETQADAGHEEGAPIPSGFRLAFSSELERWASTHLMERGWGFVGSSAASVESGRPEVTHVIRSRILRELGGGCRLKVSFQRMADAKAETRTGSLKPCALDGLLLWAETSARALFTGPRIAAPVTAPFTTQFVPDLNIASLPDITLRAVPEASWHRSSPVRVGPVPVEPTQRSRRGQVPFGRAQRAYAASAIHVFKDHGGRTRFAKDGVLLDECALRRATNAAIPSDVHTFCSGNDWVWALLGVPAGGLLAYASFPEFEQGNLHGVAGTTLGITAAIATGVLALSMMRFGHSAESGEYHSRPQDLKRLAAEENRRLREALGLSEAETQLPLPE